MNTATQTEIIQVSGNELQFIRKHAPKAFARTVSEALTAEGYPVDRVTVHKELHTIKDGYDTRIINKSRELLQVLSKVEFENQ
ncbi:hypothetical protein HP439_13070 [Sphingobacterium shayense]|uniref:hypothetical protein n=1 Tax=Sphingobacterium shayense TaxID=626343 RepID=UPI0015565B13|nr:hypothetical protein [Sphingobacterium shayense]NQD71654.1 hypothetical protein [Sphingobacterium shayense]